MKWEAKWRTFFLRVKKNNSCCLDPPPVIMINGRKQNSDSHQFPCNCHDQGRPSSLPSLEDSKVIIEQRMETDLPGAMGTQGRAQTSTCSQVPIPSSFPKCSLSSSLLAPWGHRETCLTSHPRVKVQEIFLLSHRSWHAGTPPPSAAGAQGTRKDSVFCPGRYGRQLL